MELRRVAAGGENWIDYDTTTYNKSLVLTYNYAYSGATIDSNLVAPYTPTVRSFTDQVDEFLTSTAPWTSSNTLFSVWIGINDIDRTYLNGGDRDAFSDTLVNAYFALVQKLVSDNIFSYSFLLFDGLHYSSVCVFRAVRLLLTSLIAMRERGTSYS